MAKALASLDADFKGLCVRFGRPSISPERLIRASLPHILFSIRSEGQLMGQMRYNLLFRWFVGLGIDDQVRVPTVVTKNRDRLMSTEMSRKIMAAILAHREVAPLLSDEHFLVDGTLLTARASMKSFQPKARRQNRNAEGDFRGEKRSNATHASITDPEARLYKNPRQRRDAVLHRWRRVRKRSGGPFSRRRP